MKVISLDIETLNVDMDAEGLSFDNPKGWQTSCICIYDFRNKGRYHYSINALEINDRISDFEVYPFSFLFDDLEEWFYNGYTLVTHNGKAFDLPILRKTVEEGGADLSNVLELFSEEHEIKGPRHIDTCAYLLEHSGGWRFSLQNLIKSLLGSKESKLMDGAEAPKAWANGEYERVLEYCMGDAFYTAQVFYHARRDGKIVAPARKNGIEDTIKVRVNW